MIQKKYNKLNILLKNYIKEYNIDKDKACSNILITKDVRKAHSFRGGIDSTFSVIRCVCCY